MSKYSAEESYKRMAQIVKASGATSPRQITRLIAEASGVSFQAASKWKDGRTKAITMPPIKCFCDKYKASPDYIATGKGSIRSPENYTESDLEVLRLLGEASPEQREMFVRMIRSAIAPEDPKGKA